MDPQMLALASVLISGGVIASVPLALAALGETFAEKSGLLNLGIEGMMLIGAFAAFFVSFNTQDSFAEGAATSVILGLLAGLIVGALLGLFFGFLTITLKVDQVIVGLGMTVFGGGLTGFLFREFYGTQFPLLDARIKKFAIPGLSEIPVLGQGLFRHQPTIYLTWLLVIILAFILNRTQFGLSVKAAGENPLAADAAGVNVFQIRYVAILIGGGLAGLGGAFLSVSDLGFFGPGFTVGQGFIAIAIAMLGRWQPGRVFLAAVIFGILRSMSNGIQLLSLDIRPEFVLMLPYLGVLIALVFLAGRTALPAALGIPYERGKK